MRRVLITGGAGFIGSAIADALLARGDAVVVLDNMRSGSADNLQGAMTCDRFELIVGDVCDREVVDPAVRSCDAVLHLAARIGLKLVLESPLQTLETNVNGTEEVLRAATRYGCRTLVASSSEVYGLSTRVPSRENDPIAFGAPSGPRWSYACSKAVDEFLTLALHRERGLPATVVRLFNTVGPRQSARYGMVLPRFARQALSGEPLTVYGDGTQTRCFCHIDDVVAALLRMLDCDATIGEAFNVGNPHEIAIVDLAAAVIAHARSSSTIEFVPFDRAYAPGFEEIYRRVPCIDKLKAVTGFEPAVSLDSIVASVVEGVRGAVYAA